MAEIDVCSSLCLEKNAYRKDNVCAPTPGHTFNVNSNEEVSAGTLPLPTLWTEIPTQNNQVEPKELCCSKNQQTVLSPKPNSQLNNPIPKMTYRKITNITTCHRYGKDFLEVASNYENWRQESKFF